MLVTTHVGSQKGIGRRSSLCLVYIQELTRNAYDNLNYRSEKRLIRLQNDSTMAHISFTKVAREAGAISFWLVYSSNISVCQPPYLASLLHFSNVPRQLRSSTSQQLSIPRTKLNLGKRAFSVAAPIIWNELPTTLKSCESLASFRKNLKTYLFKIASPH